VICGYLAQLAALSHVIVMLGAITSTIADSGFH